MSLWSPVVENVENGTINVANFPATQPVSATDLDIRNLSSASDSITVTGAVSTTPLVNGTAVVTSVSVSPTVATLAAANAARIRLVVFNEGGVLLVKLGSGASPTSYSYRLAASTVLEVPTGYTGIVTGVKVSNTSNALVTEF